MKYARVAVEATVFTFDKAFDYEIPAELESTAKKGCRVTVPFGNGNKKRIGIIYDITDKTESKRVKKINEVLDEEPLLSDEMLGLAGWIKDRTFCTLYEAAKVMLPTGINHRIVASYAVSAEIPDEAIDSLDETEKEILDYLYKRAVFVKADAIFKALGMENRAPMLDSMVKKEFLYAAMMLCVTSAI